MDNRRSERGDVLGTVQVWTHCTFQWRQPLGRWHRFVEVDASHCVRCLEELRRIAPHAGYVLDRRKAAESSHRDPPPTATVAHEGTARRWRSGRPSQSTKRARR
jgi:hypothetical protein